MNTWQREALYHAKTEYPKESCGLVIEKNGSQQYYPCNNIEIDGVNSFTIDPEDWAKAEDTGKILHICHSHPNGDLRASELYNVNSFCLLLVVRFHQRVYVI